MVVRAPAFREPCTAPAAPDSACISCTLTVLPKMFFCPLPDHWSTKSAIGLDGVIRVDGRNLGERIAYMRRRLLLSIVLYLLVIFPNMEL